MKLTRAMVGIVVVAASAWTGACRAQSEDAVQRERISRERQDAEAEYLQRQYDCSRRFIVSSCMDKAKSDRRAKVDSLRRQEEVLDADERRRRAAERLEAIRLKTEAQARLKPVPLAPAGAAPAGAASAAGGAASTAGVPVPVPGSAPVSDPTGAQRPTVGRNPVHKGPAPRTGASADQAGERAAAAERRRAAALKQSGSRERRPSSAKPPAAPLPPRPAIPPASSAGG